MFQIIPTSQQVWLAVIEGFPGQDDVMEFGFCRDSSGPGWRVDGEERQEQGGWLEAMDKPRHEATKTEL